MKQHQLITKTRPTEYNRLLQILLDGLRAR